MRSKFAYVIVRDAKPRLGRLISTQVVFDLAEPNSFFGRLRPKMKGFSKKIDPIRKQR